MSALQLFILLFALHVAYQIHIGLKEKDTFNGRIMILFFRDIPLAVLLGLVIWIGSWVLT